MPQSAFSTAWGNPQVLEIGILHRLADEWTLTASADWEACPLFVNTYCPLMTHPRVRLSSHMTATGKTRAINVGYAGTVCPFDLGSLLHFQHLPL